MLFKPLPVPESVPFPNKVMDPLTVPPMRTLPLLMVSPPVTLPTRFNRPGPKVVRLGIVENPEVVKLLVMLPPARLV